MGMFWSALMRYPWQALGATGTNLAALSLYSLIPWYYKNLFDALSSGESRERSAAAAFGAVTMIAALNAARWILRRASEALIVWLQPQFMQDTTMKSFGCVTSQSNQFFANNFSGSLVRKIQRLTTGIMTIHDVINYQITSMAVTMAISLWLIGMRSLTLLAIFAGWLALALVFNAFVSKKLRRLRVARAAIDSKVAGTLSDAITNSSNIRLFAADRYETGLLRKVTDELREAQRRNWRWQNHSTFTQVLAVMIMEVIVIYWCVQGWLAGTVTVGDIVLAQSIMLKLSEMVWNLNTLFRNFYEAYADSQEMIDIFNSPPDIVDVKGAKKLKKGPGAIVFSDVQFNYNETREIMRNFFLEVKPKEKVALVGSSGAGKTTVVKLLFRLYDLTGGKILIDGQDISKVTQESLHQALSMVPQDPLLFHRSLMENIRYGRRGASDEEVYAAAKKARCHEFISALPQGYDTLVGERGVKLSGGERQRVAIARAILKDAPILVLDEATSSLDSESEKLIHDALHELMKDKTVIVIAHRLSTIMEMDRIVVIDDGKIVDQGSHDELIERTGTYKKLWEIQAGSFLA